MAEWRAVSAAEAAKRWDDWLSAFSDRHLRQSEVWARYKSGGWRPLFTALFDGPQPSAMGMLLVRRLPFVTLCWMNGGPAYRRGKAVAEEMASLENYLEELRAHLTQLGKPMLRINGAASLDADSTVALTRAGFEPALARLDSGLNMILDLRPGLEPLRAALERRWRNQLKNAEAAGAELLFGGDELRARFAPMHERLCARKGLAAQRLSPEQWRRLGETLGARTRYLIARQGGEDAAAVALWLFSGTAYLAFSAATEAGLKRNLPNLVYWSAIARLKELGCERWDLTGIDPRGNWGVYHFKAGLGAPAQKNLGEWDWSPSPWRRRLFNAALWAASKAPSRGAARGRPA